MEKRNCGNCAMRSLIGDFCIFHGCTIMVENYCDNHETNGEWFVRVAEELDELEEKNS